MNCAVQTADDGSIPGSTEEEKKQTYASWQAYNMNEYYDAVQDLTFRTEFLPISSDQVQVLMKYFSNPNLLSDNQKEIIQQLETTLNESIKRMGGQAFVKLASRSPKDAADKLPHVIIPILQDQLARFPSSSNGEFLAMRYALLLAMRCTCAQDAFQLFSYSARIMSDLKRVRRFAYLFLILIF